MAAAAATCAGAALALTLTLAMAAAAAVVVAVEPTTALRSGLDQEIAGGAPAADDQNGAGSARPEGNNDWNE